MLVFLLYLSLLLLILGLFFILFHILSIAFGAPYVGTSTSRVVEIIKISKVKKGELTLDLGSGDGRIVVAMAKKGAVAHGFELNPFYVLLSKYNIYKAGVTKNAFIHWKNFWNEDLSEFDIITVYGVSYIMDKLGKKLKKELKRGGKVISSSYSFKNWKPRKKKDFIFVYTI